MASLSEVEGGAHPVAPGAQIGRFIILRRLGAGAMGVVFEAIDPDLDRKVAIKLLQADARGADARTRLVREAQALARLSHPNVVGVFDVGVHEEHVWLAMELVIGRTLRSWLEERGPGWQDVLEVMLAAGRGLAAAHAAGLVHRDIKPDNVMLGDDGRPRVMDFGLARWGATGEAWGAASHASSSAVVTFAGSLVGTPAYMAPEQFRGDLAGPQADIFAFCVMLWEGLHGERPFAGDTLDALREAVEAGRTRGRPRGARSPRWIDAVLLRGMAPAIERRWPTMVDLLAALGRGQRRARARRWAAVAGVLAFSGVGVAAQGRHAEAQTAAACVAAGASVDAIWNDEAQARLRAGLLATGASYAATTADRVMPHLAAQAAALREARTEACLDARVRGAWDEALFERAEWCLDERAMALGALVTELAEADRDAVQGAVPAAANLAQVSPCRDRRRLEALPTPPRAHAAALDLRRRLSRAAALRAAAKYPASLEVAQEALPLAKALAWPPLVAATHRHLGSALVAAGRFADAEDELESGYFAAAAALAHEEAAAAAVELVYLVGARRARHDEGVRWFRLADVALSLLGDEDEGLRRGAALHRLAIVRAESADYSEAKALYERALAIHEKALGPEHLGVSSILNDLGILRFRMGAFDDAGALHERALVIRERALGPDHPEVALSLCNLANVRVKEGAFDDAKALLERALAIHEAALGPEHPRIAEPLSTLAALSLDAGDLARAKQITARVMAIDEKALGPAHPGVALSLDLLARIAREEDELAAAKALLERSLAIREAALGRDHPETASSLYNLALVEHDLGASAEAEALALRALAVQEQALGPEDPEVLRTLDVIGEARLARDAIDEARPILERALALHEKLDGPEHAKVGECLHNLALIALEERRPEDAAPLAERALRIGVAADEPAEVLAELRLALAQALWNADPAGPRDRVRARRLAGEALALLRAVDGDPEAIAEAKALLVKR